MEPFAIAGRLLAAAVLCLGLLSAPGVAAQEVQVQPFRPQQEISPDPMAARTVSSFSRAWSGRDAGRVASLIPQDGRASVTIESRGVSSEMSRGQIEALLAGLFAEAQRPSFELSTIHHSDETSTYAVGEWIYATAEERRHRETVFAVFRQSVPGNWILSELRIQSAR